jgi:hypothetical protein
MHELNLNYCSEEKMDEWISAGTTVELNDG